MVAVTSDTKWCSACGATKIFSDFYPDRRYREDGKRKHCKECDKARARQYHADDRPRSRASTARWRAENPKKAKDTQRRAQLKADFGISPEQYEYLASGQGGTCVICQEPCASGRRLAVEHCHDTGQVRGLACSRCNVALGMLKDCPNRAAAILVYLKAHGNALSTEDLADFVSAYTRIDIQG